MVDQGNSRTTEDLPTSSDVRMVLQLTTKVDITPTTQPLWLSSNAFAYVSGCSIIKYDLRGPQCTIMPRRPSQGSILVLSKCEITKEDTAATLLAYIYSTLSEAAMLVVRPIDSSKEDTIVVQLPIDRDNSIKCLSFLNKNKHIALLTHPLNGLPQLSIYKMDKKGTEIVKQPWQHTVKFLLEGVIDGSFITVDELGLSMHSYCSLGVEADMISPLLLQRTVYSAKIHASELVLLVTKEELLFCWPQERTFRVESIDLRTDILEADEVGAATIKESLVVIALSKQRLLAVEFNHKDTAYCTKIWVDTGLTGLKVEMVVVSNLCQNVLMLCRNEKDGQRSLEVFDYEIFGLTTKKKVRATRLPMDCEGCTSVGIAVSNLKEQAWRLTNRSVSIYPHLEFPLDHPTCIAVDPYGLFVVIGFQFYFNIFAVRRHGLMMLHSVPALYARQVSYLSRLPLIVIMLRHEIRLYHSHTYEQLWEEETSTLHSEFLMFQVSRLDSRAVFLLNCGTFYTYDLAKRERTAEYRIEQRPKFFEFDWRTNTIIYSQGKQLRVFHCQDEQKSENHMLSLSVSSIRLCPEMGVLFLGFEEGSIGTYRWPISIGAPVPSTLSRLFEEPVVCLQFSANRSYLYAATKSGNFSRLTLTFYQKEQEICMDTMISILREHGVGFSTYYLNNMTVQATEKCNNVATEIQNLEFEQQGKALCYQEQAQQAQSRLQQEQLAKKKKFRNKRNGVLVHHRDVLRRSQRKFSILSNKLSKIESMGLGRNGQEERYFRLICQNERLAGVMQKTKRQFQLERQNAVKHYEQQLNELLQEQGQIMSVKQNQFQQAAADLDRWEQSGVILTEPEQSPLEIELKRANRQLEEAKRSNEQLQAKIANFEEEFKKFEIHTVQCQQIEPALQCNMEQAEKNNNTKQEEVLRLEQEHTQMERILEEQAKSEKHYETGSVRCGTLIEEMLNSVEQLEFVQIRSMQETHQSLSVQFEAMQGYLAKEAQATRQFNEAIQQTLELKDSLKGILSGKLLSLRMGKYRIKEFAKKVEDTKQQLLHNTRPARCSVSRQQSPQMGTARSQQRAVVQLRSQAQNNQRGLQHFSRSMNTSVKLHVKENEGLLCDLNRLTVANHNKSCILREKANFVHAVQQSLKNHIRASSTMGTQKKRLTPFEKYHLDKASTEAGKLRRTNQPRISVRTSNSTNCSILDSALSSCLRTPLPTAHEQTIDFH